jgi:hypothetical protein
MLDFERDIKALKQALAHAVTRYDRKQEKRKNYNPYALGIYLGRVDDIVAHVKGGAPVEIAIRREFNDRLADFVVKFVAQHTA